MAAPSVERAHAVGHAGYALWIFAVPVMVSALIEAPIALASDRLPRRVVLVGGLGALAASLLLCAAATTPWALAAALALAGAASGVACAVAQAELVTRYPGGAQRAMSRWVAFAAVGDAIAPLLVAAALWLGGSYRLALVAIAGLLGLHALLAWRNPPRVDTDTPDRDDRVESAEDAASLPLMAAVRSAARRPRLWWLLTATSFCLLLDELVIALAALRLHDELGWSDSAVATALAAVAIGAVLGAVVLERLLAHQSARALLIVSALGSLAALALLIAADSVALTVIALFLLGLSAAPHYPLTKAAAYDLAPGNPGVVNALLQVFVVFEIALPLAVGAVAAQYGLRIALAALALQPIAVLAAAFSQRR